MTQVTSIQTSDESRIAEKLKLVLADTYGLYFKTHAFHWNVEGERFISLHTLFEEHYNNMWMALDEIAERIRSVNVYAPYNSAELAKITKIEDSQPIYDAGKMLEALIHDHGVVIGTLKEAIVVAEEAGDDVTADLLLARTSWHEKTLWMLRSLNK